MQFLEIGNSYVNDLFEYSIFLSNLSIKTYHKLTFVYCFIIISRMYQSFDYLLSIIPTGFIIINGTHSKCVFFLNIDDRQNFKKHVSYKTVFYNLK